MSWLFREWCFGEEFGSECLGLFLFCFCLVRGKKVASAQDFGWQSKGGDHFKSWFSLFSCLLLIILYCSDIAWSKDLFCIFLLFSSNLWLGILFLFVFLPIFDWEFSSLAFFRSLIGNFLFLFFVFFWGQGWAFSPWVKVYGELGFWLKACRLAGHDICQSVGLASDSGKKEMSHIISTIHMQHWWLGNFMQNWSCCTHVDTQASSFYGHVTLGLRIHFSYLSQPSVSKT